MAKSIRKTNINMRATPQEKLLLEKAANLAGFSNLTNFMMTAARKEAYRIISEINTIHLSEQDWNTVVKLLSNPPEPNEALKELFSSNKESDIDEVDH